MQQTFSNEIRTNVAVCNYFKEDNYNFHMVEKFEDNPNYGIEYNIHYFVWFIIIFGLMYLRCICSLNEN